MPDLADPSRRFVAAAGDFLPANLAALWRVDPALAARLEALLDEPGYDTEPSRAGPPTLALAAPDGRKLLLHSRYDPLAEAHKLAGGTEPAGKGIYAIHGLGLGYHVQALFARVGRSPLILVLEPDLRLIRTALAAADYSAMLRSGRVLLLTEPDRGVLLGRLSPHQHLAALGLELLVHPPSLQFHAEFHREMQRWLTEFAGYCRTNLQTLLLNGRRTCENLIRNVGWYAAAPDLRRLQGRHRGQPAIIVSAGPSVRRQMPLLRQASGRAVLIAVQTMLKPLLSLGIEPDYVTSLDYHEISTRFYENLPPTLRTELVAEPKAASAVLAMYPGPLSLLGSDYCDKLLREPAGELRPRQRLRAGATVAHLAFYLAEYLGCDPIIFVGQDLAFTDGLCYAPGTSYEDVWRPELGRFCTVEMKQWEHIARERPILRRVEDWHGRPLYTEERLLAYLQQFERDFAAAGAAGRRIIDATEGGARKRGATPMPLEQALAEFCAQTLPPAPADHPGLDEVRRARVPACLQRRCEEARAIADIGRRTLPLLEHALAHLDDAMEVNRTIAALDQLRAAMLELNDTYELVMQLSQPTELARFQRDFGLTASGVTGTERQRRQIERDIANVRAVIAAAGDFETVMMNDEG